MSDTFYQSMMDRYGYRPDKNQLEAFRVLGWYDHVAERGYDPTTGETDKAALWAYSAKRWRQYRNGLRNKSWSGK